MDIWIKDLSLKACNTRFGKVIPKIEKKVDMIKYFGKDVLNALKADPLIKVIVHNAKDLQVEKKQAQVKEEKKTLVIEKEEKRKSEVTKNLVKKSMNKAK